MSVTEAERFADRRNPDFIACDGCGGEFYQGDLDLVGRCGDCADADAIAVGLPC